MKYWPIIFIVSTLLKGTALADLGEAYSIYRSSGEYSTSYLRVAEHLQQSGLNFSAIPFIKEYMLTAKSSSDQIKLDKLVEELIPIVGVRQFEALSHDVLSRSLAPTLRFIQAKKYFRSGKYASALRIIQKQIPDAHPIRPFALFLMGSVLTIKEKYPYAKKAYNECIHTAEIQLSKSPDIYTKERLEIVKDYCVVGIARNDFTMKQYAQATLSYLDLDKRSHVWPEILFEEAWSSFYEKNYNRTLGKLVTYKSPVLNHMFNPEVAVLRALTYLKLCLWSDANYEVEQFYSQYQSDARKLETILKDKANDYKWFYELARNTLAGSSSGISLVDRVIKEVIRTVAFKELFRQFQSGKAEIRKIVSLNMGKFSQTLKGNLKRALLLQRNLIGSQIKNQLIQTLRSINDSFSHMSYIKLEILRYQKSALYTYDSAIADRKRGDIRYLKRNNKQYFWTFNGEFWADELGDYVFALKSVCTP